MFENIMNLDELRKAYRAAAMKSHPDHGGSVEEMQAVNAAYEIRFQQLKDEHNAAHPERPINETPEQFRNVIEKIINLPGIIIELCGSWIWVSGDTRTHREALKAAGMYWAAKKKMWYWRAPEDAHHGRGSKSMSHIRQKYGSERITSDGRNPDMIPA